MKRIASLATLATTVLLCASLWAQTSYSFQDVKYTANNAADQFTQLLGINSNGLIVGYHNVNQNSGFTLALPATFTTENFPDSMMTQVVGINNTGTTVGFYVDQNGNTHGFTDVSGNAAAVQGQFATVDFPGSIFNQLLGANDKGQAAGYYSMSQNNSTPDTPYVYDEQGAVFQVIVIPGAIGGAQATGINNSQQISGFYIDANGVNHGFLLNFGRLVTLDAPGSIFTQALGLNNNGQVVGQYMDAQENTHGFVWTAQNGFTTVDDPNGIGTTIVNGINDAGVLVGFYGTSPVNTGFVAQPVSAQAR
jgi:probable HAF family extracellular repeat protein